MNRVHHVRAIGYIRVSTEGQAQEGVSLDAQRVRLKAHCTALDIQLVDIVADEGQSASSLDRPGLRYALSLLTKGKADALIVVKLDRLTRSVKDLGHLCESYFGDGKPYSLLSVCDAIDTRSASGKLVLNVLTSVAQWEREAISDRTKEALTHLRQQGVYIGAAPYGWRYSEETDERGRRYLIEDPAEQPGVKRACELYDADVLVADICKTLEAEGIPSRGPRWHRRTIYRILARAGYVDADDRPRKSQPSRRQRDRQRPEVRRDKAGATERACVLRGKGFSLRQIGARLLKEGYLPPRGEVWHAASVLDLLRTAEARRTAA